MMKTPFSSLSAIKRSLLALQTLQSRLAALERSQTEAIAIIGLGCRLPQAENLDAFWQLLKSGADAITEVPTNRWSLEDYYNPDPTAGKLYSRYGGFLKGIEQFDPQFFNISLREAKSLDPQQRLLLEVSWEALEHANQVSQALYNTPVGVFTGISTSDYALRALQHCEVDAYFGSGNSLSMAAGRVAYTLGLTGPAVAVDTACSSSLVAVHLACQSLRQGECRLALAGGVNLILSPENSIALSKARMLSSDGRCKTFDASADGYVRSEGCGVVVLKRLSDAIADHDNILAIIRGTAVNQDGPSGGLTVPNGPAQQAVIRQALSAAKVEPWQVQYVEAHGTGTSLGDPIELIALGEVYGQHRSPDQPLIVGSVKTNLGHLETAAGITGLIKLVLALNHQEIPPHLHFQQPSPHIPWHELPITIPTCALTWSDGEHPRFAGLSSFSFSGTNAHLILESAPTPESRSSRSQSELPAYLLNLSAKSASALQEMAQRYAEYLRVHPAVDLGDLCLTANAFRSQFKHRLALIADSRQTLQSQLQVIAQGQQPPQSFQGETQREQGAAIAFLFTGQGSQYVGMGKQLYQTQPIFRDALDLCAQILEPWLDFPLLAILYPDLYPSSYPGDCLDQTRYTQPALFALEYALATLWQSWGIRPTAVLGHSLGEYVAACIAGVFSLEDGLKLVAHRARLMQELPPNGTMAAVLADEATVMSAIAEAPDNVSIAAFNGAQNLVISGTITAVTAVGQILQRQGIEMKPLTVSHAFHSSLMEPMLQEFAAIAREVSYHSPQIQVISNLTGQPVGAEIATADYWVQHIRQPVRFASSIAELVAQGYKIFMEVGPRPTLISMARRDALAKSIAGDWLGLPSLQREQSDWQVLLSSIGNLFVHGIEVDWSAILPPEHYQRLTGLPTYPFQRQQCWFAEEFTASKVQRPLVSATSQPQIVPQDSFSKEEISPVLSRRSYILATLEAQIGKNLVGEGNTVDPHASFLELGADSINLFETIQILEKTFGLKVSVRQFFEELTDLDTLATYIDQALPSDWQVPPEILAQFSSSTTTPSTSDQSMEENSMSHAASNGLNSNGSNGNHDALSGMPSVVGETPLERVIQNQLAVLQAIISQQLDALRDQPTSLPTAPTSGEEPPHSPYSSISPLTRPSIHGKSSKPEGISDSTLSQSSHSETTAAVLVSPTSQPIVAPAANALTIPTQAVDLTAVPLSIGQQRMWWVETLVETHNVYLIPAAVQIEGRINYAALEASINAVIDRHESLRTTFHVVEGQPMQRIHSQRTLQMEIQQMSGHPQLAKVQAQMNQLSEPLFNLETDLLVRARILSWGDRHHVLLLVLHHLVADGWSTGVLIREMLAVYPALVAGQSISLPPLPIQYRDFAIWDRQTCATTLPTDLAYWQRQLAQAPTQLTLPLDAPRPPHPTYRGQTHHQRLTLTLTRSLKALSQQSGVTLFMLLLAAYSLLLSRYSKQTDILVGSTLAKRQQRETQSLIGLFLYTVMFRIDLSGEPTFSDFLKRVKQRVLDALAHPEIPFEALSAGLPAEERRTEWFQTMFILQSTPRPQLALPDFSLSLLDVHGNASKCDLSLWMIETDAGLRAEWEYDMDLFEPSTIERMAAQFEVLLSAIVEIPQQSLSQLPLLPAKEQALLTQFAQGEVCSNEPLQPVHVGIEAQAQRTPDAIAIKHQATTWSYQTLNHKANQIAQYLQAQGLRSGDLVALCLERSPELIAALLAVLKLGATYIPLDPTYPVERLHQMLDDAQVRALVTRPALQSTLQLTAPIVLDIADPQITNQSTRNLEIPVALSQSAYIIYTSGSTGKPKGTILTHRGLANFVREAIARYELSPQDRVLQFASISFDAAVEEIYSTLCSGGTLVLRTEEMVSSSATFCQQTTELGLTVWDLPTAFWHRLTQDLAQGIAQLPPSLRSVIIGGERILPQMTQLWQQITQRQPIPLWNTYGPTEATVVATAYKITAQTQILPGMDVPIGKPLGNVQAYVLDAALQPVPLGVPGELYLGGNGLADGYLNRPELTAERFIAHPFQPTGKLYKTGDRVRMLTTGDLVYLGRSDDQVKVRGFRVELGEVERVLQSHPVLREVAVIAQADTQGINRLIAYVVPEGVAPQTQALRQFLQTQLPDYMVPALIISVDAIPLTPAGKLDRRSLPQPQASDWASPNPYLAPRNPIEAALTFIVAEVLGLERVGVEDNFFSLGGHSLSAMQVLARIRTMFGKEVALRSLFTNPTVAALAAQLKETSTAEEPSATKAIVPVDRSQPLVLSFSQERLWFLYQFEGASATYNLPFALRLRGAVNHDAMEQSLSKIVSRHESLRTTFAQVTDQSIQVIQAAAPISIPVIDLSGQSETTLAQAIQAQIQQAAQHCFDLETELPLRVQLLHLQEDEHILLVTMHHIVSDAWSMGIFVREVMTLYPAYYQDQVPQIEPLPIQYADYAAWQRQQQQSEDFQQRLQAWVQEFIDAPPLLELPTDKPRPAVQTFRGDIVRLELSSTLTQALKTFSQQQQKTLFMTLLAGFVTLLHRYSRQQDFVVGTPIAGRTHPDLEGLIGFFINTLPLRFVLEAEAPFTTLLEQVQSKALAAFANQDIPFEKLIEQLPLERDLSYLPLCQTLFVLQNAPAETLQMEGLVLEPLLTHSGVSRFDLTLSMTEVGEGLIAEWEYNSDLFERGTIERMAAQFEVLLNAIVAEPQQSVATIPLLTAAERQTLLVDWNQTQTDLPIRCIHHWIEDQVTSTPDAIALAFGEIQLSYRELNTKANQLAHYLQRLGVQPNTLVGICLEQSPERVIAMLAVLKAGGAYVPLDPTYPEARLSFMVDNAQLELLILQSGLNRCFPNLRPTVQCLVLDDLAPQLSKLSPVNPAAKTVPTDLAYVIYTSGSTGQPKGVMVEHKGLGNLAFAQIEAFEITQHSRILQMASFSFDASVSEILMAFCAGATLYLGNAEMLLASETASLVQQQGITHLTIPPSALSVLALENLASVEHLIVAGEACPPELVAKWSSRPGFYNAYGPTESTVCATISDCIATQAKPPIGSPLPNIQVYVLDSHLQPVPIGVPGELLIGGIGLARGYLHRPELTAERFIPHPFCPGERLYRTGDLVRYRPDSQLDYLGRIDQQVKLRGFRIELGEIESVLLQNPNVKEGVVVVYQPDTQESAQGQTLVAYVVPQTEALTTQSLQQWVRDRLPQYMVPGVVVMLEALPLTPNGKVDRKALPAPQDRDRQRQSSYVAPSNEIEATLVEIWSELLGVASIGVEDNFFELGGHSLLAMQLLSRIQTQFQVKVQLQPLFEQPTIARLAELIVTEQLCQTDIDVLEQLFAEVEQVSEEDALNLLSGET
jgi:amino acid adenylation domain-containing protein